jgi:hypothetical protein
MDQVIPQATQLPVLNRLIELIVLGETDLRWLQSKVGFKSDRNVYYYLEAARWVRLVRESDAIAPTSLGRRYVATRFDPRVFLEGVRARPLFEDVMKASSGQPPSPQVVEKVLRRWSFRYSQSTLLRRARDFSTLFGRVMREAAELAPKDLVVKTGWVQPKELPVIDDIAAIWPQLVLAPVGGMRAGQPPAANPRSKG